MLLAGGLSALTGCVAHPADRDRAAPPGATAILPTAPGAAVEASAADRIPAAYTRGWPHPPRATRRSGCLVVFGPVGPAGRPQALAHAGAAALARAGRLWGTVPRARLVLVVPPSRRLFAQATGTTAATAVTLVPTDTRYGPVTVVRPDIVRGDPDVLASVLTHECVHLLADVGAAHATDGRVRRDLAPAWVREGMAEYVPARALGLGSALRASARRSIHAARTRPLPASFPTAAALAATDPHDRSRAYDEAWLAVDLLVAQVGLGRAVRWQRAWSQPSDLGNDGPSAGDSAVDLPALRARWQAQLRRWRR